MISNTAAADEIVAVTGLSDPGTNAFVTLGARWYGEIHVVAANGIETQFSTKPVPKVFWTTSASVKVSSQQNRGQRSTPVSNIAKSKTSVGGRGRGYKSF